MWIRMWIRMWMSVRILQRALSKRASDPKIGSRFPSVVLTEGTPANRISTDELLAGKKIIMFAVPGAFTPGCHKTHLPGYLADYDKYVKKGIDAIVCTS